MKLLQLQQFLLTFIFLISSTKSSILTCRFGAITRENRTCYEVTKPTWPYDGICDTDTHSCLTGKYAGDWLAAYGCYPNDKIQSTKLWINALWCGSDAECLYYNPDGVPANGWTVCNTNLCNECNDGSFLTCSMGLIFLVSIVALL